MARITKADLDQLVTIIRNATGDEGYFIEYASGRPRLYLDVAGSVEEVSPRLPARELSYWLEGFIEALTRLNPHVPTDVMALVNPAGEEIVTSAVASKDFPWVVGVHSLGGYRTWSTFRTEGEAERHAEYLTENLGWDTEVFEEGPQDE